LIHTWLIENHRIDVVVAATCDEGDRDEENHGSGGDDGEDAAKIRSRGRRSHTVRLGRDVSVGSFDGGGPVVTRVSWGEERHGPRPDAPGNHGLV
jgi:hypothetical protein